MEVKIEDRVDFNGGVSVELQRGGRVLGSGNRVTEGILIRV